MGDGHLRVLTTPTRAQLNRGRWRISGPAPRCASRTTTHRPGCTQRPGSFIASPDSRRPSSALRTCRTRPDERARMECSGVGRSQSRRDRSRWTQSSRPTGTAAISRNTTPTRFAAAIGERRSRGQTTRAQSDRASAEPFQERLLEQIALARQLGHHRNLLVSATGTGKTVMAAMDYARLRRSCRVRDCYSWRTAKRYLTKPGDLPPCASRSCVRRAVGRREAPHDFEHVFASIQSLHAAKPVISIRSTSTLSSLTSFITRRRRPIDALDHVAPVSSLD